MTEQTNTDEYGARRERLAAVMQLPPSVWAAKTVRSHAAMMRDKQLHVPAIGIVARDLAGMQALDIVRRTFVNQHRASDPERAAAVAAAPVSVDQARRVRALEHYGFLEHLMTYDEKARLGDIYLEDMQALEALAEEVPHDPHLWRVSAGMYADGAPA